MRIAKGFMFSLSILLLLVMGLILLVKTMPPPFWERPVGQLVAVLGLHYDEADEKWIEKYQTAITGVFAIMAAAVTVLATLQIDGRAERRHRQLIALSLRPDALRVERMIFPHFASYRAAALNICGSQCASANDFLHGKENANADLIRLTAQQNAAQAALKNDTWSGGKDLMDGALTSSYQEVINILARLGEALYQSAQNRIGFQAQKLQPVDLQTRNAEIAIRDWNLVIAEVEKLKVATIKFEADVVRLQNVYSDIDVGKVTKAQN